MEVLLFWGGRNPKERRRAESPSPLGPQSCGSRSSDGPAHATGSERATGGGPPGSPVVSRAAGGGVRAAAAGRRRDGRHGGRGRPTQPRDPRGLRATRGGIGCWSPATVLVIVTPLVVQITRSRRDY